MEGGEFNGLGWFDASVIKIKTKDQNIKVPNIDGIKLISKTNLLFKNLDSLVEVISFTLIIWIVMIKQIL